jgi:hypothetical protein
MSFCTAASFFTKKPGTNYSGRLLGKPWFISVTLRKGENSWHRIVIKTNRTRVVAAQATLPTIRNAHRKPVAKAAKLRAAVPSANCLAATISGR